MRKITPATINDVLLKKLQSRPPATQRKQWNNTKGLPRDFKDKLTRDLLTNQSGRCAYCGCRLLGVEIPRDHIAPKESHPEFTFFPKNLVLSCLFCNTECKRAVDTIIIKNGEYDQCVFSIIHPILDDPADHISFVGGEDQILIQVVNNSAKGNTTVTLFRLDSGERAKQRAKDAMFDRDLEHLPGPWKDSLVLSNSANIKMKTRSA